MGMERVNMMVRSLYQTCSKKASNKLCTGDHMDDAHDVVDRCKEHFVQPNYSGGSSLGTNKLIPYRVFLEISGT